MADADAKNHAASDGLVDGATGQDDGGRDPGDVELMIFRRIRSFSNVSGRMLLRGPGETIGRMFKDPLSMFSAEERPDDASNAEDDNPSSGDGMSSTSEDDPNSSEANLQNLVSNGVAWRDAMVQACANLLGKSIDDLEVEYRLGTAASPTTNLAFGTGTQSFEPVPRDFADFAIMRTLKATDSAVMQNASSWLFNMMDRTGSGYVLREEFIRYAPFIGPVADAAVAGIVFDELVREQSRQSAEKEAKAGEQPSNGKENRASKFSNSTKRKWQAIKDNTGSESCIQQHGLRRRRQRPQSENITSSQPMGDFDDIQDSEAAQTSESPSRDMYPPSVALRYDAWRPFFIAAQDKYYCHDEDWVLVKQELGIDPFEVLIKSQGALDHSDVFPTLGKLYLSQRYLIFHAAIGRNHYVARLGSMAQIEDGSIPLMMRDSFKVHLESEIKAAIDGISALKKDEPPGSTAGKDDGLQSKDGDGSKETTLSEHIGKLMRQYTAGRKPLQFSLLEFRETKHRDHWVHLIREMVAAHKLHVQLGFGSSGRAVPRLEQPESSNDSQPTVNTMLDNEEKIREILESRSLNYTRSPFRNEPSPPLLAVAAHANIARYRALRLVTDERTSKSLLIFTDPERNAGLINWYTESVRAYNNQSGRSWIERALATIRDNMDSNDRMYRVQDDEPFDVSRLGEAIGRFADLCSPLARLLELISHLFQWRNPPATILAILVCLTITVKGWISYVPACLLFSQALCIVDAKYNYFGLGMGRTESEDAERRQANVLKLVAQVHDTLAATQNVIGRMNRELGKLQALYLWGSEEWHTWVAVGFLCSLGLILLLIPSRLLFLPSFFFLFFKHFLPPTNPAMKFWESLPSRVQPKAKKRRSKSAIEKRSRVRKPEPSRS